LDWIIKSIPEFNLLLISSWMSFWFVSVVPKYLNFVTKCIFYFTFSNSFLYIIYTSTYSGYVKISGHKFKVSHYCHVCNY
jgi:hypothetical protein